MGSRFGWPHVGDLYRRLLCVDYLFGRVLPILLIIESPNEAIAFAPLSTSDPDSQFNVHEQSTSAQEAYLTSSFRRTAKHLHSIGGVRSLFRGAVIYMVANVVIFLLSSIIGVISFIPGDVATALASIACAQLSCAWTYIVLTSPQHKPWYRRLPPTKQWKKIALPTAIVATAEQISLLIPLKLLYLVGLSRPKATANRSPGGLFVRILALFGIVALGMALTMVLVLPAKIVLVRVQASLLPDTEETIVPFDRSFDGKLRPGTAPGDRGLSMLNAWKSFDFSARRRLVKAYAKTFAIEMILFLLYIVCLLVELLVIVGTDLF